jgi:hypothetical protein
VASLAGPLIINSAKVADLQFAYSNTLTQGQNAATIMTHDLRNIDSISSAGANSISFTDNNGSAITFSLSGGNLLYNSSTLAQGVSNLTFTYLDSSLSATAVIANIRYVTFSYTVTNDGISTNFQNAIYLRNS